MIDDLKRDLRDATGRLRMLRHAERIAHKNGDHEWLADVRNEIQDAVVEQRVASATLRDALGGP